ncbi:MAG: ATP-binding cassette domain-containing protein [Saprospiraceae bacterium]|nr:ATP-binding cassette domain-containing protein [Candidatus Opimibacter iunctus]
MDLSIQKLSKAFNQRPVFSELTVTIPTGSRFAITGANGSGKSTLLKIISGGLLPTKGHIRYSLAGHSVSEDALYRYVHFVAPYNTVIEELSLPELFHLHRRLGLLKAYGEYNAWAKLLEYKFHPERQIKSFSSGMKQRVKLGLALLDDRPLILLDEPGSNLDVQGKAWFFGLLDKLRPDQTLIIASNDPVEIAHCSAGISVE